MNPFPPPRAYVDWEVPLRQDGSKMTQTINETEYVQYILWLADYLYSKEIPVPECQKRLSGFPRFIPDEFDPFAFENLESWIEDGKTYSEYFTEMSRQCDEYCKETKDMFGDSVEGDESSNREYFLDVCVASEEQFVRTAKEIAERKRTGVPDDITHADIPYRAVFSKTLKAMPSHDDRVSALRSFYDKYNRDMDEVYCK